MVHVLCMLLCSLVPRLSSVVWERDYLYCLRTIYAPSQTVRDESPSRWDMSRDLLFIIIATSYVYTAWKFQVDQVVYCL